MKTIVNIFSFMLLCCAALVLLTSCGETETSDGTLDTANPNIGSTKVTSKVQEVIDGLHDNVELIDGRIHLFFGSRVTLTVENFNKLILEEQLGLCPDDYTFVIDANILEALKHNDAYGGIAFGQEWVTSISACLKDTKTGEISSPIELMVTLHKSSEAEAKLSAYASEASVETVSASK